MHHPLGSYTFPVSRNIFSRRVYTLNLHIGNSRAKWTLFADSSWEMKTKSISSNRGDWSVSPRGSILPRSTRPRVSPRKIVKLCVNAARPIRRFDPRRATHLPASSSSSSFGFRFLSHNHLKCRYAPPDEKVSLSFTLSWTPRALETVWLQYVLDNNRYKFCDQVHDDMWLAVEPYSTFASRLLRGRMSYAFSLRLSKSRCTCATIDQVRGRSVDSFSRRERHTSTMQKNETIRLLMTLQRQFGVREKGRERCGRAREFGSAENR